MSDKSSPRPQEQPKEAIVSHEGMRYFNVAKRATKLASVIYLVTGFISDIDPVKWKLRTHALNLISETFTLTHISREKQSSEFHKITDIIHEIILMLDVALVGGLITEMNTAVLKRELELLLDEMGKARFSASSEKEALQGVFKKEEFPQKVTRPRAGPQVKGHSNVLYKRTSENVLEKKDKMEITPLVLSEEHAAEPVMKQPQNEHKPGKDKKERRAVILDVVREKGAITVKDVVGMLPGLSEKTIQRELSSLVESHILKKEGEKRWSKYSFA